MAKQLPVIYSSYNGKNYVRSKPARVKQSVATKAAAGLFGKASTTASKLTATFKPLVGFPYYKDMYSRLNSELRSWMIRQNSYPQSPLENIIGITGFRFINEAGINNRFVAPLQITYLRNGDVQVDIAAFVPAEKVEAPPGCRSFELKLMAVSCRPFDKQIIDVASQNVNIANDNLLHPPIQVSLPLQAGNNTLTLVALALKYDNITWGALAQKKQLRWMPAGIVGCLWR